MRHFILIFMFLFSNSTNGQTNNYYPFPEGNAVWNINYSLNCFWAGIANENYSIEIANDTLINFITYHTLKTFYIESFSTGTCGTTGGPVYIYRGAIRQDTSLKKVFIVPPDSSNEELLYDFNMIVGDTVRGYLEPYPNIATSDVVISIDSILIGSQYRKQWNINQGYGISIIEGIGCTFGLTEPSPQNVIDGPGFNLTCFSENGSTIYPNSSSTCNLINSIHKDVMSEKVFTIFPNPNSGNLTVKLNSTELSKLELFNIYGQLIWTKIVDLKSEFEINILNKGLYFIVGYDHNGRGCCRTKLICQ